MTGSNNNGQLGKLLSELRRTSEKRRRVRHIVMLIFAATLAVLMMLLGGCASQPLPPPEPQLNPTMPVVPLSAPTISFSQRVATFLEKSRQLLISASQTTKP